MQLKGSEILVETLIEQGVDTIFGYPGGAVLDIYEALYQRSDRITHYITSHEQGAAHAADGFARASGKVGVVLATSGPGATNLVTGIATAFLDSTPMVAITGNVGMSLLGKDSFQEVDIAGVTMPITKHNYIVKDVNELADTIREAFTLAASGRPGPVLIDIPKNIQNAVCEYTPQPQVELLPPPVYSKEAIDEAVELIKKAEKPFIFAGGGVVLSDTSDLLLKLAEAIDAPIGTSMMGISAVPRNFKGFLGMVGMHGRFAATKSMYSADLIIAVGTRFSDRATGNKVKFCPNAKIIHIDIDEAEINKNIPCNVGIVGALAPILTELTEKAGTLNHDEWTKEVQANKDLEYSRIVQSKEMNPKVILETVRKHTSDSTPVATDVGQHQMWVTQFYDFMEPRKLITSGGLGTMGFGLGAAIGACIANDKKTTVMVTGDGSFHMNLNELATCARYNLPVKVILMNNNVLGMVRQWQTVFYDKHYSQTTLDRKTNYKMLAEAMGGEGFIATTPDELKAACEKAFATEGFSLIDCRIDSDEFVLPMIPANGSISDIIMKKEDQ